MSSPTEVFEQPALWRCEIITDFRLRGAERCAAASPAPGFPQVLESLVGAVAGAPSGPWLDVGGGLGGAASWVERNRGTDVVLVDPASSSLAAARQLFPTLPGVAGTAQHLPVRSDSIAVVLASGVLSLQPSADALFSEAARVCAPGGYVLVTDLWSACPATQSAPPNTFWSLEDVRNCAEAHGLVERHLAVADVSAGWWSSAAEQVDEEVVRRFADRPGFDDWQRDRTHIERVLASGDVVAAGMLFRSAPTPHEDGA